jgi:hypothetical protein
MNSGSHQTSCCQGQFIQFFVWPGAFRQPQKKGGFGPEIEQIVILRGIFRHPQMSGTVPRLRTIFFARMPVANGKDEPIKTVPAAAGIRDGRIAASAAAQFLAR